MRRQVCLAAATLFVLAGACSVAEEEPQYDVTAADSGGLPNLLMLKAKAFAQDHPKSSGAPRAGLDWYVAATATGNEAEKNAARAYLLLEHPTSVPAAFIFRTLAGGDELAKCLLTEFEREDRHLTNDFLYKYVTAASSAPGEMQGTTRSHANFLLSLAFAHHQLRAIPEAQRDELRKYLGAADKNGRLFELIVNKNLSVADKLVDSQEFNDTAIGRAIQRGWFVQLWLKEEIGPPEYRIYAENMLYGHKWSYAIPWIEKIPPEMRDAQVSFWRGWTLAVLGRVDEGREELQRLAADKSSGAEWSATAAELVHALEHHQKLNEEFTSRCKAIQNGWRQKLPEVLEVRFTVLDDSKKEPFVDGYVGVDTTRDQFEFFLKKQETPLVAFRVQGDASALMTTKSPSIISYAKGAQIPMFAFRMTEVNEEAIHLSSNFNMQPQGKGRLAESLKSLLGPALQTEKDWIARIAAQNNRHGQFLLPQQKDAPNEFVWLAPKVENPHCDRFVVRLNDQGIESLAIDRLRVELIRMGAANETLLSPPAWPDLPITSKQELEASELMAVVGVLGELVHSGGKAAKN